MLCQPGLGQCVGHPAIAVGDDTEPDAGRMQPSQRSPGIRPAAAPEMALPVCGIECRLGRVPSAVGQPGMTKERPEVAGSALAFAAGVPFELARGRCRGPTQGRRIGPCPGSGPHHLRQPGIVEEEERAAGVEEDRPVLQPRLT